MLVSTACLTLNPIALLWVLVIIVLWGGPAQCPELRLLFTFYLYLHDSWEWIDACYNNCPPLLEADGQVIFTTHRTLRSVGELERKDVEWIVGVLKLLMLLWRGRLRGVRRLQEMHHCRAVLIDSLADSAADFSSATSVLCWAGWYGASLQFVSKLSVLVYFEMYFSQSVTKINKLTLFTIFFFYSWFQNQVHLTKKKCFFECVCIGHIFVCWKTAGWNNVVLCRYIYFFMINFIKLFLTSDDS